jgi:hypothetical protein
VLQQVQATADGRTDKQDKMAQYTLDDIKRISICPILYKKGWDYSDPSQYLPKTYLYGIKEIFRWYYRRGNQISPDAIVASLSHHAFQTKLDWKDKMNLETAFRKYTSGGTYRKIDQPFYQKEIQINLNDRDVLTHTVPCITKKDKSVYIISYDKGEVDMDQFLNSYEVMLQSVWAFYVLDTVPIFLNLFYNVDTIFEQKVKVNVEYIKRSKKRLVSIGREMAKRKAPPPSEICKHCNRRKECPEMINVEKLLRL